MKFFKSILAAGIVLATAGSASASGWGALGNHTTEFTQGGSNNFAKIEQYGYENRFGYDLNTFTQGVKWDAANSHNELRVYQDGKHNVIGSAMSSYQTGHQNKISLKQTSNENKIRVVRQTGQSFNKMVLEQAGFGKHLIGKALQSGDRNTMSVKQRGYHNVVAVASQNGSNNKMYIDQGGAYNRVENAQQHGNWNEMKLVQADWTTGNNIDAAQDGDGLRLEVTQYSSDNYTRVRQTGSSNRTIVIQR